MPIGLCKLCRQNKDLRDSHYIPRAMYKGTAAPGMRNPNPVVITRKQTGRTSRQIRDYVLCGDCERRFNKNGEDWMLKALGAGKRFPLRDRLDVAVPESATAELRRYSCSTTGINAEKLGYFALSVFWRGGIHDWRDPFGSPAPKLDLAEMEEPIRKYLYGEEQIPGKNRTRRACLRRPGVQRDIARPDGLLDWPFRDDDPWSSLRAVRGKRC